MPSLDRRGRRSLQFSRFFYVLILDSVNDNPSVTQLPLHKGAKDTTLRAIAKPSPVGEGGSRRLTDEEFTWY